MKERRTQLESEVAAIRAELAILKETLDNLKKPSD